VQDEGLLAEKRLHAGEDYLRLLAELRKKARAQGLWCPFIPKELGGMGLGPRQRARADGARPEPSRALDEHAGRTTRHAALLERAVPE
jgi:alkylation response protein AidB-like acyl-CoA dehydrogenase